ncbi:hypothetical protein EVAR_89956_1 [Eumeta japonica]|uniref:Uncharacterized protein n=1 Tax=Eumeta variegata TaxID=151549 RepID=A0A4C2ACP5_EUMVA|nr:hypothetical protein EVAR_89956_1 [Eumeta japonica]
MQVQVKCARSVVRRGSTNHVCRIGGENSKAVPPTLRVTEPRSRKPHVALRNMMGDPSSEAVLTGLYEQNSESGIQSGPSILAKECRVAFKNPVVSGR